MTNPTTTKPAAMDGEIVHHDDIRPYDIICGRSKAAFNNVGNRRFRVTIELNLKRFKDASTKQQASSIITCIYQLLSSSGARFLKPVIGTSSGDASGRRYVVIDKKCAREKIGHALRDLSTANGIKVFKPVPALQQKDCSGEQLLPIQKMAKSIADGSLSVLPTQTRQYNFPRPQLANLSSQEDKTNVGTTMQDVVSTESNGKADDFLEELLRSPIEHFDLSSVFDDEQDMSNGESSENDATSIDEHDGFEDWIRDAPEWLFS